MSDNEIIKAADACVRGDCIGCSHNSEDSSIVCRDKLIEDMRDLINRQKADIERLKANLREDSEAILALNHELLRVKTEAIKEFAERLKIDFGHGVLGMSSVAAIIDNLVKEMTEETP